MQFPYQQPMPLKQRWQVPSTASAPEPEARPTATAMPVPAAEAVPAPAAAPGRADNSLRGSSQLRLCADARAPPTAASTPVPTAAAAPAPLAAAVDAMLDVLESRPRRTRAGDDLERLAYRSAPGAAGTPLRLDATDAALDCSTAVGVPWCWLQLDSGFDSSFSTHSCGTSAVEAAMLLLLICQFRLQPRTGCSGDRCFDGSFRWLQRFPCRCPRLRGRCQLRSASPQ